MAGTGVDTFHKAMMLKLEVPNVQSVYQSASLRIEQFPVCSRTVSKCN